MLLGQPLLSARPQAAAAGGASGCRNLALLWVTASLATLALKRLVPAPEAVTVLAAAASRDGSAPGATAATPAGLRASPPVARSGARVLLTWTGILPVAGDAVTAQYGEASDSCDMYRAVGAAQGSMAFRVVSARARRLTFSYVRGFGERGCCEARSPGGTVLATASVEFDAAEPDLALGVHLGLTDDASEMRVTWTSNTSAPARVSYGRRVGALDAVADSAPTRTFERTSLCSPDPAVAWHNPGQIHTAVMRGLLPGMRYFYRVGRAREGAAAPRAFVTAPLRPPPEGSEVLLAGDLGTWVGSAGLDTSADDSVPPLSTVAAMGKRRDSARMVVLVGDLSYAVGRLWKWDVFFAQLEALAGSVPLWGIIAALGSCVKDLARCTLHTVLLIVRTHTVSDAVRVACTSSVLYQDA